MCTTARYPLGCPWCSPCPARGNGRSSPRAASAVGSLLSAYRPMLSPLTLLGRSSAVLAALAATGSFLSAQCGINPNYGTNLGLGDDAVSPPQYLGFTFPFGGAFYDSVCVSSNGFLYLHDSTGTQPAPTASRCCNGDVSSLLSST